MEPISREAAIDLIDEYMDKSIELHYLPTAEGIKTLIFALPSEQEYEPIIRCSNCVHFDKAYKNERVDGICNYWNCHEVMDDWYCSQAQRGKQDG